MAEYIKRDDVIKMLDYALIISDGDYNGYCTEYVCIMNIPPADVRENVRGKWVKVSDKYPKYCCSVCNHLHNNKEYKFCPFCGALMRGKK